MATADVLEQAEIVVARLTAHDRKRLLERFSRETDPGIEKNEGVMGGAACIRQTRIPVWLLYRARQLGLSEAELLESYPGLTAADLVNAWNYAELHTAEIESLIEANERDD